MPFPPYPVMPAPISWTPQELISTGRLRSDPANAAQLLANRPMLIAAQTTTGTTIPGTGTVETIPLDTEYLDNWAQHQIPNATYPVPLGGWYLLEGNNVMGPAGALGFVATGFGISQAGTSKQITSGAGEGDGSNNTSIPGAYLAQLDPTTSDTAELLCWQNAGSGQNGTIAKSYFKAEWVAQPTSLSYGTGTVVTNPQPAALWAPGGGTTITNSGGIAAGATSMTVASTIGMVVGGYLGLDYLYGQPVSPMAEKVQITSINGLTVGITATTYPHGGVLSPGAVAVPVSAAFLNQQVRDVINFLCYPPIANLYGGTSSLPAQTWPAATPITFGSAVVDNFGGWNSSNKSQYVFPVSGNYYVYGQVTTGTASANISAGLAFNGGTIQWGTTYRMLATLCSPTVRRHVRVTAGEYVQLYGSSSSAVTLPTSATQSSRLIVVFRGF
jgi:hypothetical protein